MAEDNRNVQNYGLPLYGAAWVPPSVTLKEGSAAAESETSTMIRHVFLAGGGGEGNSGIPNAFLLSSYDFGSNCLSDQPVATLGTGSDLPYRISVHPGGEGVICSFPESCRLFEWDASTENPTLSLRSSEKVLDQLEDVGQQLAIAFNNEGSLLAVGGEDGKLRVFKWPDMETTLDVDNAHSSVKGLDFSPDGKFLASVGSGPGRIWDVSTSTSVASLLKENDEVLGFCRFSQTTDTDKVLFVTSMRDKGGSIVKWDTNSWKRISSTHIVRDPISALNVSPDGKLLAIGTIEGDILLVNSATMRRQSVVKKAHMGLVTSLAFSQDSRALVSASLDSSARVTLIKTEENGMSLWTILFILLAVAVAVAVYFYAINKQIFT